MPAEIVLPLLTVGLQMLAWGALLLLVFAPNATLATWAGRGLTAAIAALGVALMLALWHETPCALSAGLTIGAAVVMASANSGRAVALAAA
jgi:uncharacterized membrane protein YdfJ with MMPL/SSD domain